MLREHSRGDQQRRERGSERDRRGDELDERGHGGIRARSGHGTRDPAVADDDQRERDRERDLRDDVGGGAGCHRPVTDAQDHDRQRHGRRADQARDRCPVAAFGSRSSEHDGGGSE